MASKPSHIMKCSKCGETFTCPNCEEVEEDKYNHYVYKQQLFNAKERNYLDSIKDSRGLYAGGWWYHIDNFNAIIKGKFTEFDIDCILRGLKDLGKNKSLNKSIKKKLKSFVKGIRD